MLPMPQTHRNRAFLLATSQITSYGSGAGVDDGALQKGIAKPTAAYTILTLGQYSGNTNITINSKTDVHANACVEDNNTGLMWSRTAAASVGPASDGKLPWTDTGSGATLEGIFAYCAAANAAALAGYSDWRVPNRNELFSLMAAEPSSVVPPAAAFPGFPINVLWTSTTCNQSSATFAMYVLFSRGDYTFSAKTANFFCILVRGGR